MHALTNTRCYKLRIDLESFSGEKRFITYSVMKVSDEASKYKLSLGQVDICDGGTLDDSMLNMFVNRRAHGMKFSTKDADNDNYGPTNCAKANNKGGWWYDACAGSNLNGLHRDASSANTIFWHSWLGIQGLNTTSMMLKRQK